MGTLVILPFASLVAARVTSNQFVRETEANLHAQAAIYAQVFAQAYRVEVGAPIDGVPLNDEQKTRLSADWHPVEPTVFATNDTIGMPRPDPRPITTPVTDIYLKIGTELSDLARRARKTTLVGVLGLDLHGNIIARSGSDTGNLAHVDEVARALNGEFVALTRWRDEEYRNHSLRSLSRDTKFRVYVVHPVIVADQVVGAVYLSRTPSNLNKYLFQQRNSFVWLIAAVTVAAALIGFFLWRFLARPMRQLTVQASDIAAGRTGKRLPGYGVKELAQVGQSLINMGATLRRNSDNLQTYTKHATHELKSPVTSIMGAAELLEAPQVDNARRAALAKTIKSDAARMDNLLVRMREMARGQVRFDAEPATLHQAIPETSAVDITLHGDTDATLPIPLEAALMCFGHMVDNAIEHGATRVQLTFDREAQRIDVQDNGSGISPGNLAHVTEPFFTTKRETGGTGMGLNICAEIIGQFGGTLSVSDGTSGALISLQF